MKGRKRVFFFWFFFYNVIKKFRQISLFSINMEIQKHDERKKNYNKDIQNVFNSV